MSFWDTIGHISKATSPLLGVWDAARVASAHEDPNDGPDGVADNAKQFGASFFRNSPTPLLAQGLTSKPVQNAVAPIAWVGNQVSHGFSTAAAVGGMLADSGQTGLDTLWSRDLWDASTWDAAWDASEGVSGGEAIIFDQMNQFQGESTTEQGNRWWAQDDSDLDEARKKTAFKVSAGAMDIISTWYADPTLVVGKAVKVARAGDRIIDAAQADEIAGVIGSTGERGLGATLAGKTKSGPQETASRLYAAVAKTDGMDVADAAIHFKPMLERSGDPAPIVGLLGQAGRIADLEVQRAVKADVILTAAGSQVARDRLIASAPDIARALQRTTQPPEQFKIVDDMVEAGLSGDALLSAAKAWGSKGNKAELKAYARDLDDIHTRIAKAVEVGTKGGVESVGTGLLGAAKQKYRAGMAHEFFYQPGPHSRMVRVVHWATGQRMQGVLDVSDATRGHDELMDSMTRSGLFSATERRRMSEKWWSAPTKEARASMAHAYPTFMIAKLGEKHGLSKAEMKDVLKQYGDWSQKARTYVTKQMEEARVSGASRITIEDPGTGVPTSIDRLLYEKHVADSAPVPNLDNLERLIRARKGQSTPLDKAKDKVTPLWHTLEDANDIWRTLTLARPGFMARTQFDTQARSMVTIGATNIIIDAMRGVGHAIGKDLSRDAVTKGLTREQVQQVTDVAETMARRERLTTQAAELRRQAELVPNGSGNALIKRAEALEAQAAEDVTSVITGRRVVTDERTVDLGKGVKVKERAAGSDAERQMLTPALHTGPQSLSDAMLRLSGRLQGDLVEDSNKWITTMPEDPKWSAAWLRSKDALVASPAGKKILEVLDLPNVDMLKTLREAPEVRAAWREVRTGNPHFESWLDRAIAQAEWTAPSTEIRQALLSGKVLGPDDVDNLFDAADRMPVHAPAMDVINPLKQRHNLMDQTRKFVGWMSDQPDTVLGRVPFYTERYFKHFQELGRREVERTGELGAEARLRIEKVARHRAIQDTRQTMYDTARQTGAHDRAARMMFAFLGAWEDSMRAWGRMFYDDPSRIGKLTKTWYAPDRAGFIVDENGDPVRPGEDSREKWIVLPFGIPGTQMTEFKIRKDSFNSMFQGEVPWAPGFSPMVQVPVTQIASRAFPEIADPTYEVKGVKVGENVLLRQMFGFGTPKTGVTAGEQAWSVADQFTPGWMRRAINIMNGNSQQFADAYSMGLNAAMIQAQKEGRDVNSKSTQQWADQQATKTARSMMFLEFTSNFGLGLSGEGATKAEFYRQRYREISKNAEVLNARGTTVQEEMLRQHPEAAGLRWSFSENETGINATLAVQNRTRTFGKDISANPQFGWFYIGSDNVGGEFSSSIYNSQFGQEATPGSGKGRRSRMDPAEIRRATAASVGWTAWNQISTQIDLELEARGLHSIQQKGAEDLAVIKREFKNDLAGENPDWFKDYSDFDSSKMQLFVDQVAKPALDDGRLKNRSDIRLMGQYLQLRQEAMTIANDEGYSLGSQKAAELRDVLAEFGAEAARQDLGFAQAWQRMFAREVEEEG